MGNPLKYIDPDGHESKEACGYYGGGRCGIATSNIQIQTLNKAWDCNLCWDKRQQIDNSIQWGNVVEAAHVFLDTAGVADPTPISDGLNGVIYTVQGDAVNAGISFAAAAIPYAGDAGKLGKYGLRGTSKSIKATVEGPFSLLPKALEGLPPTLRPAADTVYNIRSTSEMAGLRTLKNAANDALRVDRDLRGISVDIHEIHPVKWGGSPTDIMNKVPLVREYHQQVTTFWADLHRKLLNPMP